MFHPSMWGFNATDQSYSYDNRPVAPLTNYTFDQWWFHGHLNMPPHPEDVFELPAGQPATTELACNKGATTFFASSEGGDIRQPDNPNDPCPGSPMSEWHTNGINDLFGCGLGITYQSDVTQVKPEDFTIFSVNQTCVWTRFTDFQVPAKMPPCPPGGCICAWFWIHSPDSGGEQNYMNGFKCNVTGSTSDVALAKPQVARRCGKDPANGKMVDTPGNCTYGAKQPFYWFQQQNNNMFEGTYAPPRYLDMYNFLDGAQNDIFQDSYPSGIPVPGPNQTVVPTPLLGAATSSPAATPAFASTSIASSASSSLASSASLSILSTSQTSLSSFASLPTPSSLQSSLTLPIIPSTSISLSTATVVQTAVVTVTAAASSAVLIQSSGPTTATVFSTVVVTVVNSEILPSVTPSPPPSATVTVVNTVFATTTAGIPTTPNADDARKVATTDLLAQFDADNANSTVADTTSLVAPISSASSAGNSVCKRQSFSDSGNLQRRTQSFSFLPGSRSHRRLTKKSSLWNIF
ncbi:hypothetical protein BC835DRAFT_1410509 [Cytidiella melzeri]|nr:hypothetical protein BC835DRAFT_1410509 [Cytidiella melzeri]